MRSSFEHELSTELEELAAANLRRREPWRSPAPKGVMLCSNDYLGLGALLADSNDATRQFGSGASPLISGYHDAHAEAEVALGTWLGGEALLFSSGYAANVGTLAALAGEGDLVLSDSLNHASIIDGCRLSRAVVKVYPHADTAAVQQLLQTHRRHYRRVVVVTESYFSMDGDTVDLRRIRALCDEHNAVLMVDEAHAVGVSGPQGRGCCAALGVRPDVLAGTLGKALGLHGAFVVGRSALKSVLWNRARSLVFSTAISPVVASRVAERVATVSGTWGDAARVRLAHCAQLIRAALAVEGDGPIIPVAMPSIEEAMRSAERLQRAGLWVPAIRPPTVPTPRLRFTASAALSDADLTKLDRVLRELSFS